MNNSPYLDRETLSERERELVEAARRLVSILNAQGADPAYIVRIAKALAAYEGV